MDAGTPSDRPSHRRTRCCIVGGGPAGMMLGYLLARAGIESLVLEKHADFFRDFRGDTVHPSTLEVMDELGLLEEFLKLPHQQLQQMTRQVRRQFDPHRRFRPAADCNAPSSPSCRNGIFSISCVSKGKRFARFHRHDERRGDRSRQDRERRLRASRPRRRTGAVEIRADLTIGCRRPAFDRATARGSGSRGNRRADGRALVSLPRKPDDQTKACSDDSRPARSW